MAGKEKHLFPALFQPVKGIFQPFIIVVDKGIIQHDWEFLLAKNLAGSHTECKVDLLDGSAAQLLQRNFPVLCENTHAQLLINQKPRILSARYLG